GVTMDIARLPATNSRRFMGPLPAILSPITPDWVAPGNNQDVAKPIKAACAGGPPAAKHRHETPRAEELPSHRRQGRIVAVDRLRQGRIARVMAEGAGGRSCETARRGLRRAGGVLRLDRAG